MALSFFKAGTTTRLQSKASKIAGADGAKLDLVLFPQQLLVRPAKKLSRGYCGHGWKRMDCGRI